MINSPDNLKSHGKNIASYLISVKILSRIYIRIMAALAIVIDVGLVVTAWDRRCRIDNGHASFDTLPIM